MSMSTAAGASGSSSTSTFTLGDVIRAPSNPPDVVVLDRYYDEKAQPLNYKYDLWLSTADDRYISPPIRLRVGPLNNMQTFYVHKNILERSLWFRKALRGGFLEGEKCEIDLPEEDPALFHFIVAFLYEKTYEPVKSLSTVIDSKPNKGKGIDLNIITTEEPQTNSTTPSQSFVDHLTRYPGYPGVGAQQALPTTRNRAASIGLSFPDPRGKRPGTHRAECRCPRCRNGEGSRRCWHCGASRVPPEAVPPQPPGPPQVDGRVPIPVNANQQRATPERAQNIEEDDMSTWLMQYELNTDVYICANRFLMDDFCAAIRRSTIDMLEGAGTDAAHPTVLRLAGKLYANVPETDELVKMLLARIGFLQPTLWARYPEETNEIMQVYPEMVTKILLETVLRHQTASIRTDLPPMETGLAEAVAAQSQQNGMAPYNPRNYAHNARTNWFD